MKPFIAYQVKWEFQQKTLELEKNTSLDWRMQSIEDDTNTLQSRLQGGNPVVGQERVISQFIIVCALWFSGSMTLTTSILKLIHNSP